MNVIKQIGNLIENTTRNNPEVGRVYDADGISPTLTNMAGGGSDSQRLSSTPEICRLIHRGTGGQQGWIFGIDGLMATIPSSCFKDPPKILIE